MFLYKIILLLLFVSIFITNIHCDEDSLEFCTKPSGDGKSASNCPSSSKNFKILSKYILYDVNPPEGFNLRRDVYMRMAIFARMLKKHGNWQLVLPPWGKLYHWQSKDVGNQDLIPWSLFFDLPSLQKFAPVLDMHQFFKEYGSTVVDDVFVLQHYKDAFENGRWEEKFEVAPCLSPILYRQLDNGSYSGRFWGYSNVTARRAQCVSFHGHASQLLGVLQQTEARVVLFDHAEVALHDRFGDQLYWMARRSMRFSDPLVDLASTFRRFHLNSSDADDGTMRPRDWMHEKAISDTRGGPYLCAHLRRKDFLWGRPDDVPSIAWAAKQIRGRLLRFDLETAFIATDAPDNELEELKSLLSEYRILRFEAPKEVRLAYKDGGMAIVEQIICSHARYFVGTFESTFSFRIQEEREILGFPPEMTFNRLCGDGDLTCSEPSKWRIVY